ncbi:MAG: hypothetical protein CME64_17255 [Halobacteriovoraceae bacterium]|nr:hypothetical protein [Halobacteriovoraceae bacterium]
MVGLQGKSILCVDDDQDFLMLVKKILENVGMQVYTCLNLSEAVGVFVKITPDIILLDLNLEFESGKKLLKAKRQNPKLSNIPIMVCSGENKRETIEKVIALGGNGYILKPIRQTHLIHSLKKLVGDKDRPVYKFPMESPPIQASLKSDLLLLSETKCVVRSNLKCKKNQVLEMSSDLLNKEDISTEKLLVLQQSQPSTNGLFDTTLGLVGLTEEEIKKVKKLKTNWSLGES